jgi:formate--tetrahydrofolate ligase
VKKGCANLGRHIENVKQFGVPVIVAMNHFTTDTDAEIAAMKEFVSAQGSEAILCKHWAQGSAGIEELARKVVQVAESGASQFSPLYPDDMKLFDKIDTIVKRIYRGSEAIADKSVRDQLKAWEDAGYGHLPVCMAKTQYSFSTDPSLRGAPTGHTVPIREVRLSAGAGFVVVICGEVMTMPGLPKAPSSEKIFLNEQGYIEGLF